MPIPKADYDEMIERHAEAARVTERIRLRAMLRTLLLCWCWALLGMFMVGSGVHTTSATWGPILFWGGLLVGNGGWLFTMVAHWRAAAKRGEDGPPA
jgi:hypothetical protein